MQCLGRLPSKELVYFTAEGPRLHRNKPLLFLIPKRCSGVGEQNGLCAHCISKRTATHNSLERRGTKYIPNQGCLLHGTIIEPIPEWSRLYKGAWWSKQVEDGYSMSPETLEKSEQAFCSTHKDVDTKIDMKLAIAKEVVKPVKEPRQRMTRKKISTPVVAAVIAPIVIPPVKQVVAPVIAPIIKAPPSVVKVDTPVAVTHPPPVKKQAKRAKAPPKTLPAPLTSSQTPFRITNTTPIIPTEVVEVEVVKIEIDGRQLWLDKAKDKVYDLKYNYLGRIKDDTIDSSFPDSDCE
jgi:hypothetical protein